MLKRILWTSLVVGALIATGAATAKSPATLAGLGCHAGAYRLIDGSVVSIVASTTDDRFLRYRFADGRTGRMYAAPGGGFVGGPGWDNKGPPLVASLMGPCATATPVGRFPGTAEGPAEKIPLRISEFRFDSGGTSLRALLVQPAAIGPAPLVVMVHGSETHSAVRGSTEPYLLAAQGIAVLVYDKRGTGLSHGRYTQDFDQLAGDVAAVVTEGRRRLGVEAAQVGLWGQSQGGWVAPLAAGRVPIDFVVVGYGLAQSPLDEDAEEVQFALGRAGFDAASLADARLVTNATGEVIASGFTRGFEELKAVKARFGKASWFRKIDGEFSGQILRTPPLLLRTFGRSRVSGTPWRHDPLPVLRKLPTPMLWVLAQDDDEAPSAPTLARLRALQKEGRPIDIALFPGTTHGMIRFTEKPGGERVNLSDAPGYIPVVIDWIRTRKIVGGADRIAMPRL